MEIRQLRYFLKIAELGSFSKASLALHIAQPALSQQMARLENELGHPLLHRRHNGVHMTEQGEALHAHARRVVKQIDDLPNVVKHCKDRLTGAVSLGLPQTTAPQFAMPLITELAQRLPAVSVEFHDEMSGNLLRHLNAGQLDIAVLVNDQDARLVNAVPLMDEELFLASSVRQDHGAHCRVADLAALPLALPGVQHGVRALVDSAIRAHGASPRTPAVEANSMGIMRRAVELGMACSVMPWGAVCDEVGLGTIRITPLAPRLTRRVHVCTARDGPLSLAGQAVRDLLIEITRHRVESGQWLGVTLL